MIFLTVGSQLPFDRLTRALDDWCRDNPDSPVFGQIADPGRAGYHPENYDWERFIAPEEFDQRFASADLIIAHAGMGSIIAALMAPKPIVIMPRRGSLGEHRNDHQASTAERFKDHPNVHVAQSDQELAAAINAALAATQGGLENASPYADDSLVNALRQFILHGERT